MMVPLTSLPDSTLSYSRIGLLHWRRPKMFHYCQVQFQGGIRSSEPVLVDLYLCFPNTLLTSLRMMCSSYPCNNFLLLQAMGWTQGTGLGKSRQGIVDPILVSI